MVSDKEHTNYSTKAHYDHLWKLLSYIDKPTISDAAIVMCEMGNTGWWDADLHAVNKKTRETTFEQGAILHEAGHIISYAGHTPFQEGMSGALMEGFGEAHSDDIQNSLEALERTLAFYQRSGKNFYRENYEQIESKIAYQPRDIAINYAAGMYLYQKFNALFNQGEGKWGYDEQLKFSRNYDKHDEYDASAKKVSADEREDKDQYDALPPNLLKLSSKEWRAITAIATGLYDAKDTPYPNRLKPIQDKLEKMGIRQNFNEKYKDSKHAANITKKREGLDLTEAPHGGWEGRVKRPVTPKEDRTR